MLRIRVTNGSQREDFEHPTGPLEFGRTNSSNGRRFRINDPYVSRDQLRIEELDCGRIRVENLSQRTPVKLTGGQSLAAGSRQELPSPLDLFVGQTQIQVQLLALDKKDSSVQEEPVDLSMMVPYTRPTSRPSSTTRLGGELKEGPAAEALVGWLDTVIALQQMAPDSPESYARVARAVVELVGLDLGLVLLRRSEGWRVVGSHTADDRVAVRFSRTLAEHVAGQRRTFYQDLTALRQQAASLDDVEAVVAAPVFGLQQEVVGILYGARCNAAVARGGLSHLEVRLVDLLASVISANLLRAAMLRTRVHMEEVFSSELIPRLEREASLLNGRSQEVTFLRADLRGFQNVTQRLVPDDLCRLLRELRSSFTERILEQGGVVVDYSGDGIHAMWNAPVALADHALRAARTALDMLDDLALLNGRWQGALETPLALGIGIHTGPAQVGNTGSTRKFKYGAHGHTVNLAGLVQEATQLLDLPILVTGPTRKQLPADMALRRLGRYRLPGAHEPLALHELHGESAEPEWQARRETYENAVHHFEAGQLSQACQVLLSLVPLGEDVAALDMPTHKLLQRAWQGLGAAGQAFDPVIDLAHGS